MGLSAKESKENEGIKKVHSTKIGNKMICPVTGEKFVLKKNTPKIKLGEKTYYFCRKGCVEKFQKEYQNKKSVNTDLEIANEVVCPVMGTKFVPTSKSPKVKYKDKTYYFCCASCVEKFNKDPKKYIKCCNKKEMKHKNEKGKMCNICDDKHKHDAMNKEHKMKMNDKKYDKTETNTNNIMKESGKTQ